MNKIASILTPAVNVNDLLLRTKPQQMVEMAKNAGLAINKIRDLVAYISVDSNCEIRWASSNLTTNGTGWGASLVVVVYINTKNGVATATCSIDAANIGQDEIVSLVNQAVAKAEILGCNVDAADLTPQKAFGNWDEDPFITEASVFAPIISELGEMFDNSRLSDYTHAGYAEHNSVSVWVSSISGVSAQYVIPSGRIEFTARSNDGCRSTWLGKSTRSFTDLNVASISSSLQTRLEWQRHRLDLPAGKYTTVLPSGCVGDMVETMRGALNVRDAIEGNSFFASQTNQNKTMIGDRVVKSDANLFSDPNFPGLEVPDIVVSLHDSATESVFDTGLAAGKTSWIDKGYLKSLDGTRSTSKATGIARSEDCGNLILAIGEGKDSLEDMIADVEDGILCTSLWYIRDLDPEQLLVTGLTRDGVYRIKNGEVIGATNNFRFNESAIGMLNRVRAAGATEITQVREHAESVDAMAMPPLTVSDFNFSSVSEAN